MNSIRPIQQPHNNHLSGAGSLRKAANSPDMPKLTKDETDLIKEKFTPNKKLHFYSMDGKVNEQQVSRGLNIDTKA